LGRVILFPQGQPSVDWSGSRLQEISKSSSACDANLGVDPSVTLAIDPPALKDQSAASDEPAPSPDPPVMAELDPLDLLTFLAADPSQQS
jgi:hypothetical protein